MSTAPNQYYYGTIGGEPQGPMPLEYILGQLKSGAIDGQVAISKTPDGPWEPLGSGRLPTIAMAAAASKPKAATVRPGLTSCDVCGGRIAKSAIQCPHCGKRRTSAFRIFGLLIAVIAGVIIIKMLL